MTKGRKATRVITDPSMEPYFITMDDTCITVNLKVLSDIHPVDSDKDYNKILGHYSNMGSALKAIAKNKTHEKSYDSLQEYIDEYKNITDSLNIEI